MLDGNMPTSRELLTILYKISAKISEFVFITFSSISINLIAKMLGWFLYYWITHRIGSKICSTLTEGWSYREIFHWETALVKKSLNVSAISFFWSRIKYFSTRVILSKLELLSIKWYFLYFEKDLLSKPFFWSRLQQ